MIQCVGPIAQLVELPAHNRMVGGSSPSGPTIFFVLKHCCDHDAALQPLDYGRTLQLCLGNDLLISET